ncbi:MAG: hypothetical protein U0931_40560 [Vulcanimicrobiota bacterium]
MIDDVSRLVPYAQFFFDEKLPRMEHTLKMAILRRGLMNRVYTDNGNIYRANQFKPRWRSWASCCTAGSHSSRPRKD